MIDAKFYKMVLGETGFVIGISSLSILFVSWLDIVIPNLDLAKILQILISLFTLIFVVYKLYRELREALKDKIITDEEFNKIVNELKLTKEQADILWNILKSFSKK